MRRAAPSFTLLGDFACPGREADFRAWEWPARSRLLHRGVVVCAALMGVLAALGLVTGMADGRDPWVFVGRVALALGLHRVAPRLQREHYSPVVERQVLGIYLGVAAMLLAICWARGMDGGYPLVAVTLVLVASHLAVPARLAHAMLVGVAGAAGCMVLLWMDASLDYHLPTVALLLVLTECALVGAMHRLACERRRNYHLLMQESEARQEIQHQLSRRREVEEQLREALVAANGANLAKSTFLSNMSHEIRTPMNGILGLSELLLDGHLDAEEVGHVIAIQRSAKALTRILNDVLDLSKVEAGQLELQPAAFPLASLFHDALVTMRPLAEQRGLALIDAVQIPKDVWVVGDAVRLRQVLLNLLGNAVKFTEKGSVTLDGRRHGDVLTVAVRDTGVGIAHGDQALIFERFAQADTPALAEGTGLGLSISASLIARMGGELGLESAPGVGSTFTFSVMLAAASAPRREEAAEPATRPMAILVVEDNPVNRRVVEGMLSRDGHVVTLAVDGEEGVDLAMAGHFDVIFMDVRMPEMDGLEATRALRARGCRWPIVALTANAMVSDEEETRRAGMDAHLCKPLTGDALRRVLADVASGSLTHREDAVLV